MADAVGADGEHVAAQVAGSRHLETPFDLLAAEVEAINSRRPDDRKLAIPQSESDALEAIGLSLSGGGIRSAATCLGALQALANHGLIQRIDYISTVSGGGYIGNSMSAALSLGGEFPFGPDHRVAGTPPANDVKDTPAVGHIRNYSNYLLPNGLRDALTALAIIIRGLVANLGLGFPVLLVLASITIISNPTRSSLLQADIFGITLAQEYGFGFFSAIGLVGGTALGLITVGIGRAIYRLDWWPLSLYLGGFIAFLGFLCDVAIKLGVQRFPITIAAVLIGLFSFFVWAVARSLAPPRMWSEFRDNVPTMFATFLCLAAGVAFIEFQPLMLAGMFDSADAGGSSLVTGTVERGLKWLATLTAPIAGLVLILRQQITDLLKKDASQTRAGKAQAWIAKLAIWAAAAALPLLIWIAYLYLSLWGVVNDKLPPPSLCPPAASAPACQALTGTLTFDSSARTLNARLDGQPHAPVATVVKNDISATSHTPQWLAALSQGLVSLVPSGVKSEIRPRLKPEMYSSVAGLYLVVAVFLFAFSWWLSPNANSLHRLYRDRLSKAFLFDPTPRENAKPTLDDPSVDQGRDFPWLDNHKLTALCPPESPGNAAHVLRGPYPLINAALNIQGSDFANRRGRNADFFLFSPLHVGSEATHYCNASEFESFAPGFDLATAMAISGAAASSNMGAQSIRPLTPTLALLNIRLGYWLINPRYVNERLNAGKPADQIHQKCKATQLYLWSELTGRLYENSRDIYLTDGGHIENLGIYELLRRRCRLIIAVDAEADPAVNLPSFITLQRYARIDLGVRIDLPWSQIRKTTRKWMAADEEGKEPAAGGPHVAIGTIDYGSGAKGYLVYIKSSLTGDENDNVRDYARRFPDFPHETTGDQFFSEEQFEVYRALGFHMTHGWLSDSDCIMVTSMMDGKPTEQLLKFNDPGVPAFSFIREWLGMPTPIRSKEENVSDLGQSSEPWFPAPTPQARS